MYKKLETLKKIIKDSGNLAIAFSSGVDSTFLLHTAHEVLGDNVIAITVTSLSFPKRELKEAVEFCKKENIKQITFKFDELTLEGFCKNPKDRCYICKKALFENIKNIALVNGIKYVAEGSNTDDNNDYRPGLLAISELGIKSPLREAGFTKSEIRTLSKEMGLPTWEKPSFACLSSRFAYGEVITKEKLEMVDKSEQLLFSLGFRQFRVRIHGQLARIEVLPDEIEKIIKNRDLIAAKLKEYGFVYVSLDLQGYRIGSMNETLDK